MSIVIKKEKPVMERTREEPEAEAEYTPCKQKVPNWIPSNSGWASAQKGLPVMANQRRKGKWQDWDAMSELNSNPVTSWRFSSRKILGGYKRSLLLIFLDNREGKTDVYKAVWYAGLQDAQGWFVDVKEELPAWCVSKSISIGSFIVTNERKHFLLHGRA